MKIERKEQSEKFIPVIITLETQGEIDYLYDYYNPDFPPNVFITAFREKLKDYATDY